MFVLRESLLECSFRQSDVVLRGIVCGDSGEKLMIINSKPDDLLNKRSELISKCRHENKFYLRNN